MKNQFFILARRQTIISWCNSSSIFDIVEASLDVNSIRWPIRNVDIEAGNNEIYKRIEWRKCGRMVHKMSIYRQIKRKKKMKGTCGPARKTSNSGSGLFVCVTGTPNTRPGRTPGAAPGRDCVTKTVPDRKFGAFNTVGRGPGPKCGPTCSVWDPLN